MHNQSSSAGSLIHHLTFLQLGRCQPSLGVACRWSAHALLCGYREVDTDFDLLHALEPTFLVHHLFDRALGNLPEGSIAWVHASSRLKMYWSLYSSSDGEILVGFAMHSQLNEEHWSLSVCKSSVTSVCYTTINCVAHDVRPVLFVHCIIGALQIAMT